MNPTPLTTKEIGRSRLILPDRWPDESIYSLLAKIVRINGLAHLRGAGLLVGEDCPSSVIGCPVDLRYFSEITNGVYGSPWDILCNTTPLLAKAHLGELSDSLFPLIESGAVRLELGLLTFGVKKAFRWRFCKECAERDRKAYGISYWHRSHLLPYSQHCAEHHLLLSRVDLRRPGLLDRLLLPADCMGQIAPARSDDQANELVLDLSKLASEALKDSSTPFLQETILATYKAELSRAGVLNSETGKCISDFSNEFCQTFGIEAWPALWRTKFLANDPQQLLSGIVDSLEAKPFSKLLLVNFLFGSWTMFKEQCSWQDLFSPYPADLVRPEIRLFTTDAVLRKHRQACLEYKASRTSPTRYEFMRESYRAFRWLLHNDREWLDEELPLARSALRQRSLFDD